MAHGFFHTSGKKANRLLRGIAPGPRIATIEDLQVRHHNLLARWTEGVTETLKYSVVLLERVVEAQQRAEEAERRANERLEEARRNSEEKLNLLIAAVVRIMRGDADTR